MPDDLFMKLSAGHLGLILEGLAAGSRRAPCMRNVHSATCKTSTRKSVTDGCLAVADTVSFTFLQGIVANFCSLASVQCWHRWATAARVRPVRRCFMKVLDDDEQLDEQADEQQQAIAEALVCSEGMREGWGGEDQLWRTAACLALRP